MTLPAVAETLQLIEKACERALTVTDTEASDVATGGHQEAATAQEIIAELDNEDVINLECYLTHPVLQGHQECPHCKKLKRDII